MLTATNVGAKWVLPVTLTTCIAPKVQKVPMMSPDPSAPADAVCERRQSFAKLMRVAGTGAGANELVKLTGMIAQPIRMDIGAKI